MPMLYAVTRLIKDAGSDVIELHCTYDPATLGANPEGRKVKGVIHWVSAQFGKRAQVRLYDRLFTHPRPDAAGNSDYREYLNPDSLLTLTECIVEPAITEGAPGECFQFEREGYFCVDTKLSTPNTPVFNRTVTLRDSWAKIEQQQTA